MIEARSKKTPLSDAPKRWKWGEGGQSCPFNDCAHNEPIKDDSKEKTMKPLKVKMSKLSGIERAWDLSAPEWGDWDLSG